MSALLYNLILHLQVNHLFSRLLSLPVSLVDSLSACLAGSQLLHLQVNHLSSQSLHLHLNLPRSLSDDQLPSRPCILVDNPQRSRLSNLLSNPAANPAASPALNRRNSQ